MAGTRAHSGLLPTATSRGRPHTSRAGLVLALSLTMLVAGPIQAATWAQEHGSAAAAAQPATGDAHGAAQGEHAAEGEHGESLVGFLSRIANFLILAGGLYYFLRSPIARYLEARGQQIRRDLEDAAATRADASRRLASIEAQVAKLPAEIAALEVRGKEEIAAAQVRMQQAAEAERHRLVEQARREIDRQLHIARRELTEHAADLAIGVARTRLSRDVTADDQMRLVDRYIGQVGGGHE